MAGDIEVHPVFLGVPVKGFRVWGCMLSCEGTGGGGRKRSSCRICHDGKLVTVVGSNYLNGSGEISATGIHLCVFRFRLVLQAIAKRHHSYGCQVTPLKSSDTFDKYVGILPVLQPQIFESVTEPDRFAIQYDRTRSAAQGVRL